MARESNPGKRQVGARKEKGIAQRKRVLRKGSDGDIVREFAVKKAK